jgi:hypothetical protein
MITVFSPDHVLRSARTELYGGELVRPHESPERAQIGRRLLETRESGLDRRERGPRELSRGARCAFTTRS